MSFFNENRYSINELAERSITRFAKLCRKQWNGNGEQMSRDLAGYFDKSPTPVTCRNWMNGNSNVSHKNVKAVEFAIKRINERNKRSDLALEISEIEADLAAKKMEFNRT